MTPCRQLLMWSVPSIAVILGIVWIRKKREYAKSDPRGREKLKSLREELAEAFKAEAEAIQLSPVGKADRSIIKSAPIDIVPNGSGSQRSSPMQLTDEEVDLEIEKIIKKKSIEKERKSLTNIQKQNHLEDNLAKIVTYSPNSVNGPNTFQVLNNMEENTNSASIETLQNVTDNVEVTDNLNFENCIETDNDVEHVEPVKINEIDTPDESSDVLEELNHNLVNEPIDRNVINTDRFSTDQTRHISERDSANHSPMDPILASPSMCHFSDSHSEVKINFTIHIFKIIMFVYIKFIFIFISGLQ